MKLPPCRTTKLSSRLTHQADAGDDDAHPVQTRGQLEQLGCPVHRKTLLCQAVLGSRRPPSQLSQERHQVRFLLLGELQSLDDVEELDGVLQSQTAAVVKVRRAVLDAPQRESLHRPVPWFVLE